MDDLAALVAAIGTDRFGATLMGVLRLRAGADMCSAFTVTGNAAAVLVAESADPDASTFARIASLRYAQRYWRRDVAGLSTLGRAHRKVQVLKRPASGIRDLEYHHECYSEGAVIERLSLFRDGKPAIIASAYRARSGGTFAPRQIDAFAEVAPLLQAILLRHAQSAAALAQTTGDTAPLASALAQAAGLSAREASVAAFILSGRTMAETAAALNVAESTAVTYRRRVYAKMGVDSRAELRSRARAMLDTG
jgi:DNA-binding CsgD family transcriptional regulator